jgi:hypothetical protein
MITTLTHLMSRGIEYKPSLGVWIDEQGVIYQLKDKNMADIVEFDVIEGDISEHISALQTSSLSGDDI